MKTHWTKYDTQYPYIHVNSVRIRFNGHPWDQEGHSFHSSLIKELKRRKSFWRCYSFSNFYILSINIPLSQQSFVPCYQVELLFLVFSCHNKCKTISYLGRSLLIPEVFLNFTTQLSILIRSFAKIVILGRQAQEERSLNYII